MSTKVKGEAIREGSIPLSALATEVKEKIENAGGGADWNAQNGESGYIENRTHYYDSSRLYSFDLSNADITYDDNGNISKVIFHNIVYTDSGFFVVNTTHLTSGYSLSDSMFLQKKDVNSVHNGYFSSYLKENDDYSYDLVCIDFVGGDSIDGVFSGIKYTEVIEEFITTLDEKYIPDTIARYSDIPKDIVKTTPQELSDVDKNQALANLGIDPVVWRYICNPLRIQDGSYMLSELVKEGNFVVKAPNAYRFIDSSGHEYTPVEIGDTVMQVETSDGYVSLSLQYDGDREEYQIVKIL